MLNTKTSYTVYLYRHLPPSPVGEVALLVWQNKGISLSRVFWGEVRCYVQRGLLLHTPLTIMVFPLSDNNRRRRRPPGGSQDVEATVRTMIRQIKKYSISICNTFFKCFCQETQGNKGQNSFIFLRISYQARPSPPPPPPQFPVFPAPFHLSHITLPLSLCRSEAQ